MKLYDSVIQRIYAFASDDNSYAVGSAQMWCVCGEPHVVFNSLPEIDLGVENTKPDDELFGISFAIARLLNTNVSVCQRIQDEKNGPGVRLRSGARKAQSEHVVHVCARTLERGVWRHTGSCGTAAAAIGASWGTGTGQKYTRNIEISFDALRPRQCSHVAYVRKSNQKGRRGIMQPVVRVSLF